MMRWQSRRDFVAALLAASALGLAPGRAAARRRAPPRRSRPSSRPSRLVLIHLVGGMDDLHSIDPKEPGEVRRGVAPTFAASQLVAAGGSLRLAPPWAPLAPWLSRMQVISGVQTSTVAHETGYRQVNQMRRNVVSPREPSFAALFGEAVAPDAPLHAIHLGPTGSVGGTLRGLDDPRGLTLAELHRIANDESLCETARSALAAAARRDAARGSSAPFQVVAHLIEKMRGTARPAPPPASALIDPSEWPFAPPRAAPRFDGQEFSWALHALACDLAPAVVLEPMPIWDTHGNNDLLQAPLCRQLASWVRFLLDEIESHPALAGTVAVVVLSELGRFPYPNSYGGKDHFPQISAALVGPGLAPGRFGETGLELGAEPVRLATGRPGRGGTFLTLDDLGRTLLEWSGCPDPDGLGYHGRVLEFALA